MAPRNAAQQAAPILKHPLQGFLSVFSMVLRGWQVVPLQVMAEHGQHPASRGKMRKHSSALDKKRGPVLFSMLCSCRIHHLACWITCPTEEVGAMSPGQARHPGFVIVQQ